jgi:hypothetical protein
MMRAERLALDLEISLGSDRPRLNRNLWGSFTTPRLILAALGHGGSLGGLPQSMFLAHPLARKRLLPQTRTLEELFLLISPFD